MGRATSTEGFDARSGRGRKSCRGLPSGRGPPPSARGLRGAKAGLEGRRSCGAAPAAAFPVGAGAFGVVAITETVLRGFFRRGGRGGLGSSALIDRLIRFMVWSTPTTFTLTT